MSHLIAILLLSLACAAWIVIQRASVRLGIPARDGSCGCGGGTGSCQRGFCTRGHDHGDAHEHEHEHAPVRL